MTTNTSTTDRAAWDAALAEHRSRVAAKSAPFLSDEQMDAACDAEAAAWGILIETPAPDIEAVAIKLLAALDGYVEGAERTTDASFLTRLLDSQAADTGYAIVRILQDALRIAGLPSPVTSVVPTREKAWPEIAEVYRAGVAAHVALHDGPEEADDHELQASHDRLRPVHRAIVAYQPTTLSELAEKADLLTLDTDDHEDNIVELRALAADARRLSGAAQ